MKWEILNKSAGFEGFFKLLTYRLRHSLFAGGLGPEITRELIERGHAAAVLPYDAARDEVVLIEQFRIGALDSPKGPWLLEVVAGLLEPGETSEEVVRREAMEEAGVALKALRPIHHYYSSPGGSTERIALYAGHVDSEGVGGIHGLEEEGEDIRVHVVAAEQAFDMLDAGLIDSAMPIIALQWLKLNRADLRAQWR